MAIRLGVLRSFAGAAMDLLNLQCYGNSSLTQCCGVKPATCFTRRSYFLNYASCFRIVVSVFLKRFNDFRIVIFVFPFSVLFVFFYCFCVLVNLAPFWGKTFPNCRVLYISSRQVSGDPDPKSVAREL